VFAWYVKINGVALYVKTVGALHIDKGQLFLRKQFQANSLSVQMH